LVDLHRCYCYCYSCYSCYCYSCYSYRQMHEELIMSVQQEVDRSRCVDGNGCVCAGVTEDGYRSSLSWYRSPIFVRLFPSTSFEVVPIDADHEIFSRGFLPPAHINTSLNSTQLNSAQLQTVRGGTVEACIQYEYSTTVQFVLRLQ
jgi:hypothetical protein